MSELKVEMTNTFSLAKCEMDNLLYRKSSAEAQKLVDALNGALNKITKVFSKRFVMTEGEVWYDFVTGLILPQFEKNRPVSYNIDDIATPDYKKIQNMPIEFCGFTGRLMTEQEAQMLLQPEVRYPYRHSNINKFDIMVGWIAFNAQKATRTVYKACKAGAWMLTKEFSFNQDVVTVYDSTQCKLIKGKIGRSSHAVAIPVYALTGSHPLGRQISNEEKKRNRPMTISQTKYRKCRVRYNDDSPVGSVCTVYIRKVEPTKVEYVVASPKGIAQGEYFTEVIGCELE